MSINNSYRIQIIESDGETTRYNFECFIYKKEDLKIKVMDDKANITELEYGNDYNVENQFDYYNGGYFNLAEPQKKGIYIVIYRETPIDQQINFMSLQAISPMNLTKMFDKLTVICQELNEQFYRSMKFDFTDISLIEQDKPLDETNIKNIDKEINNDYVVALTLKYNQETNKWELATSKTNPDDKKEQGSESDYGVYKIATTEETKIGEDDTKIITPLKLKNGIDDRIATQEEAIAGINNKKYITPKTINETIKGYIADTETSLTGEDNIKYITPKTVNETVKNYIATQEEAVEGMDNIKYITPNTLKTTTNNRLDNYTKETIITNTIFQYKAETIYSIGQPCYTLVNNEPIFYYSIKDDNINNNPTEDTEGNYWKQLKFGRDGDGSNLPIGSIITSTIPITDANLHLADGAKIAYDGVYKEFYNYMITLYTDTTIKDNIFCTEEQYNNSITATGNCGKYVLMENEYIRLPTINGWIENITDINNNGLSNEAGLPNITGTFQGTRSSAAADYVAPSGAFKRLTPGLDTYNTGGADCYNTQFNASYSNAIYGKSTTVQPKGVKYLIYIVLGTVIKTDIEIDINQIANDINLVAGEASKNSSDILTVNNNINSINTKLNTATTNITALQKRYLIESYADNEGNWYNKYNDGWCEQGAKLPNTGGADIVFNLLVPFKDTNYFIVKNCGSPHTDTPAYRSVSCYNLTTTTATHTSNTTQTYARWFACGYYK